MAEAPLVLLSLIHPVTLTHPATTRDRLEMNLWMLRTLGSFTRGGVCGAATLAAPAVRSPAKAPDDGRFVRVVYVVGVEGVGHHGLTPVLTYALLRKFGWRDAYVWWRSLRDIFLPATVVDARTGAPLYEGASDASSLASRLAARRAAVATLLEPLRARCRGGKRVIQLHFNMSVFEATPEGKTSTL